MTDNPVTDVISSVMVEVFASVEYVCHPNSKLVMVSPLFSISLSFISIDIVNLFL